MSMTAFFSISFIREQVYLLQTPKKCVNRQALLKLSKYRLGSTLVQTGDVSRRIRAEDAR